MSGTLNSQKLIHDHFKRLSGVPCWDVHQGYGSFVTMNYGQPHLDIREAVPDSKSLALRRRRVSVCGEFHLWIEQCDWAISEDEKEIAMSESDSKAISMALARIDGQLLKEVYINPVLGTCRLQFEYQMSFSMCRYSDYQPDDAIWHLFSPGSVISYIAAGRIEHGSGKEIKPASISCREMRLSI